MAKETRGYTMADLQALIRECVFLMVKRGFWPNDSIQWSDIQTALTRIRPSLQRDVSIDVMPTSWEDIGGLEHVKQTLREMIEWPIIYREQLNRLGIRAFRGVLLYGPPGCSKTTLVKAVATNCKATFLSIHGAAIYSPYVGDAEQTIRELFHKARISSPSVIFLDEIDAIVAKRAMDGQRTGSVGKNNTVQERVLSTLLNEMDGIELAEGVIVVGATNRPDMLDPALMRPGRFDRLIYVGAPDRATRQSIFRIHTKPPLLDSDVDLEMLSQKVRVHFSTLL